MEWVELVFITNVLLMTPIANNANCHILDSTDEFFGEEVHLANTILYIFLEKNWSCCHAVPSVTAMSCGHVSNTSELPGSKAAKRSNSRNNRLCPGIRERLSFEIKTF